MNFTIARTIGYSALLILVNFVNQFWGGGQQSLLALFFLGSFVAEIGIPAIIPKVVEVERRLFFGGTATIPKTDIWRRVGLICVAISIFAMGLIMSANAMMVNPACCHK